MPNVRPHHQGCPHLSRHNVASSPEAGEGVVMPLDHMLDPAELEHNDGGDGNSTFLDSRIPPIDLAYNTPFAATPHAKNNAEEETESENNAGDTITRSGRISRLPEYLRDEFETANLGMDDDYHITLTKAERRYYEAMSTMEFGFACIDQDDGVEAAMVGAGIGGGFVNTNELHTHTFDEAMASPDRSLWLKAVEAEYRNMKDNGVFEPTQACDVPTRAKILTTTWVTKKKGKRPL
jgi:hypothetical protein